MIKGIERLRQSIENQRDVGEGEFRLSFVDVEAICKECEDELARLSWAQGVPAPVDANGEVVPLTTRVMYDKHGHEIALGKFIVRRSDIHGFVVYAADQDGSALAPKLLHLRRPDSWERLEKDVFTLAVCKRLADPKGDAEECIRRAKALAERDAKEAGRG